MTAAVLAMQLLLMISVGFLLERRQIAGPRFCDDMSSFLIGVALPCLIIRSMQMEYSVEQLKSCALLLLMGLVFLAVSFAAAYALWGLSARDHRARSRRFSLIFTNFTFVGIPVMEALYGDPGVFSFVIFLVPLRIALYSLARPLLTPEHAATEKQTWSRRLRGWLSPPLVGVLAGLGLYITGWRLPPLLAQPVQWLAGVCTPMGMIVCGMSLAKYPVGALLRKSCLLTAALRCLVMPGLFLGLSALLKLDPVLARPMVVCSMLPVASTLVIFTVRYEKDPDARFESAGTVFISTVLSAATIPLWSWALSLL